MKTLLEAHSSKFFNVVGENSAKGGTESHIWRNDMILFSGVFGRTRQRTHRFLVVLPAIGPDAAHDHARLAWAGLASMRPRRGDRATRPAPCSCVLLQV